MNKEGWIEVVKNAMRDADNGDLSGLDLLGEYLEECDLAKQELRNLGYGWTGLGILKTVKQITNET